MTMGRVIELSHGLSRHRNRRLEEANRRANARAHHSHLKRLAAKMRKPAPSSGSAPHTTEVMT